MVRGSVYFVKHINISPIKIGYSQYLTPKDRMDSLKTYSPYGIEIIGVIICNNPKDVEQEIHQAFANRRLNGEWFDITREDCLFMINKYSPSINNDAKVINKIGNYKTDKNDIYNQLKDSGYNKCELARIIGVSRRTIHRWSKI